MPENPKMELTPRSYQIRMMEEAVDGNIVACLPTGTGKTFIGVLVIKELAYQVRKPFEQDGKRTFFLVPTVTLVHQQSNVLRCLTDLEIGSFYGEMKLDLWSKEEWQEQFKKFHVLVMTAEIFRCILEHGFLPLSKVNLIVFDECHRAVGNHPYREIVRNYDVCLDRPKILGLTASILNGKCKTGQLQKRINNLEKTLRSRVVIPEEMSEMNKHGTKPKEVLVTFKVDSVLENEDIEQLRLYLNSAFNKLDRMKEKTSPKRHVDILSDKFYDDDLEDDDEFDPYKFARKYVVGVQDILMTLGLWCAFRSLKVLEAELQLVLARSRYDKEKDDVLESIWSLLSGSLEILKRIVKDECTEECLTEKYVSPKLRKLLEILNSKHPSYLSQKEGKLCGVIFVEKRFVAYILNQWLVEVSRLSRYNFIVSNFMVGHGSQLIPTDIKAICMQSKQQKKVLEDFRAGKYNLLVASSVIEEGMDVPHCNLVVRFDPPSDFRAYVQSKGRARAKNSIFILMSPNNQDKIGLLEDITTYTSIEQILPNFCQDRELPTEEEIDYHMSDQLKPPYMPFPRDGGARVTMTSSISLLNRYCSKLMGDSFTHHAPRWRVKKMEDSETDYQCTIWLPMISPIREPIVGDPMKTKQHAKMAAALDACQILHKRGELNDNLLPINFKDELLECGQNLESYQKELRLGASNVKGSYKKKTLDLEPVTADSKCYFYIISMHLVEALDRDEIEAISFFDPSTSLYRFALVVKEKIVKIVPFHIYTESGKVKVNLTETGPCNITEKELQLLHRFHEYTFVDMLNVAPFPLKYGSKKNSDLLLAPIIMDKASGRAALHQDLLEKILRQDKDENCVSNTSAVPSVFDAQAYNDALVSFKKEQKDLYYVIKVCHDMNSRTQFPKEGYTNFEEFFSTKHGFNVRNPNDPLIQTKHVSNPIALMPGYFSQKARFTKQSSQRLGRAVHFLPEFLIIHPFPGSLYKQATYLPSILTRVTSLIFVENLRTTIVKEAGIGVKGVSWPALDFPRYQISSEKAIKKSDELLNNKKGEFKPFALFNEVSSFKKHTGPSPSLLLEALTSRHYGDMLDLERLETVGDSFLKYAVSLFLFCKYPQDNEGKLTTRKTNYISNANLLKLGKQKEIPSIMCNLKMLPRENWLPPGFNYPSGFEEIVAEMSNPVSQSWLTENMKDIWNLTAEEIEVRLKSLDEYVCKNIAEQLCTEEPVLNKVMPNFRTINYIGNKSIADCVEGLIGAYVVTTGVMGGLHFLKWLGIGVFPEYENPEDLNTCFSVPEQYVSHRSETSLERYLSGLENLENTINYQFKNKLYLLEAVWHPSCDRRPITNCYQRLEFLGDAVLDYLITRYLYEDPKHYNPGEVTDIRIALVNNEYFARLAVKFKFHQHMRYFAPNLVSAIRVFVEKVEKNDLEFFEEKELDKCDGAAEELEVPKVLGDVVESVAGAIYLDCGQSLKTVWNVFYKLMCKDIEATRHTVPKNAVRQLYEEFPGKVHFKKPEEERGKIHVAVDVEYEGSIYTYVGIAVNKKTAKLTAAKIAMKKLRG